MLPQSYLHVKRIPSESVISPIYSQAEARGSRLVARAFALTPPRHSVSLSHAEIVI